MRTVGTELAGAASRWCRARPHIPGMRMSVIRKRNGFPGGGREERLGGGERCGTETAESSRSCVVSRAPASGGGFSAGGTRDLETLQRHPAHQPLLVEDKA